MSTPTPARTRDQVQPLSSLAMIPTRLVRPNPRNVRRSGLGELGELVDSIRAEGILSPLLVEDRGDHYLIIAGHRRHAAAQELRLSHVPCVIRAQSSNRRGTTRMVIENIQRADLDPIDEAQAYQELAAAGMSRAEIARATGAPAARISQRLALLSLPQQAQRMVSTGQLGVGAATDLAKQVRAKGAGTVRTAPERAAPHFTEAHPLAGPARLRCDLAGHPIAGRIGIPTRPVACGACWEAEIRADATTPAPAQTPFPPRSSTALAPDQPPRTPGP